MKALRHYSIPRDAMEFYFVHIEAEGKDKAGAVVSYVIDGKIESLPLPNRTVTGTWKSQKESGAFKIGRQ